MAAFSRLPPVPGAGAGCASPNIFLKGHRATDPASAPRNLRRPKLFIMLPLLKDCSAYRNRKTNSQARRSQSGLCRVLRGSPVELPGRACRPAGGRLGEARLPDSTNYALETSRPLVHFDLTRSIYDAGNDKPFIVTSARKGCRRSRCSMAPPAWRFRTTALARTGTAADFR